MTFADLTIATIGVSNTALNSLAVFISAHSSISAPMSFFVDGRAGAESASSR